MKFEAPAPAYLGPARRSSAGENKPIKRIVIHSTVSATKAGGARDIAAYFRGPNAGGSAHYVVDPYEVVQVVFDSVIAWHAPPNANSLGVELCDFPAPGSKGMKRWRDAEHRLLFRRAVDLVAQLCLAYDVPPWFVGPIGLRLGRKGVTTHAAVSTAWRQSTHWDPGAWPRRAFMRAVRKRISELKKSTTSRRKK